MLHLFNTLKRQKELFIPLEKQQAGIFVCGISVYDLCHVGHGRVMIVYDLLYRHLLSMGLSVNYVRNITVMYLTKAIISGHILRVRAHEK